MMSYDYLQFYWLCTNSCRQHGNMTKVTRHSSPHVILKVICAGVGRVYERDYTISDGQYMLLNVLVVVVICITLLVTIFLLVQVRCGTNHSGAQCCYDRIQVSIPCATVWPRRTKCPAHQAVRSATRSVSVVLAPL